SFDLLYDCAIKFRDMLATASKRTPHPIPLPSEGLCTTTSQNVRTPREFFLVVLVLVLDWVSGLDYEDEDDDEDDSVAAAPLRVDPWLDHIGCGFAALRRIADLQSARRGSGPTRRRFSTVGRVQLWTTPYPCGSTLPAERQ